MSLSELQGSPLLRVASLVPLSMMMYFLFQLQPQDEDVPTDFTFSITCCSGVIFLQGWASEAERECSDDIIRRRRKTASFIRRRGERQRGGRENAGTGSKTREEKNTDGV